MASNKAPLLLFVLLLLAACHPGVPKQYIQPDEMEDLLYDYHLSQAMARNTSDSVEVRNYNQS